MHVVMISTKLKSASELQAGLRSNLCLLTVSLILRKTSPFDLMRMKVLGVVAVWNKADFSLAKKVSGTQILCVCACVFEFGIEN